MFPATTLQTCLVHLIRSSLDFASWKDRRTVAAAMKPIYSAVSVEAALAALAEFEQGPWGQAPRADRRSMVPCLGLRDPVLYVPESDPQGDLHHQCNREQQRSATASGKDARTLPNAEAATKLVWLVLRNITATWCSATHDWKATMNQFAIIYAERFTNPYRRDSINTLDSDNGQASNALNIEILTPPAPYIRSLLPDPLQMVEHSSSAANEWAPSKFTSARVEIGLTITSTQPTANGLTSDSCAQL